MARKIPYLLDSSKLFVWLSYVPPKFRIFVTVGLLILFILVWQLFFCIPLRQKITNCKEQVRNNESQQKLLLRSLKKNKNVKSENMELKNSFQSTFAAEGYSIIEALVAIADNSRVACSSIINVKKSLYEVGLIGTFYGVVMFLQQLQSLPVIVSIKKLECHRMRNHQICARLEINFERSA